MTACAIFIVADQAGKLCMTAYAIFIIVDQAD